MAGAPTLSAWRTLLPILVCAGFLCTLASPALAQRKRAPEVNGWNPPKYEITATIVSPAARAEVRRQVEALTGPLRGMPTLAAPPFPIYTQVQAWLDDEGAAPAVYDIGVSFYRPGKVGTSMDDQVQLRINDPSALWDTERAQSAHTFGERELYLEPRFEKSWHGYPINGRDFIIVARPGRELFRAVSLQEYYSLLIADLKTKAGKDRAAREASSAAHFVAERPKRRADFEDNLRQLAALAKLPADSVAARRREWEAADREMEAALREGEQQAQADNPGDPIAQSLQRVQRKYAALSPAQRAAPAYGCMDGFDEDSYLCDSTSAGARRLVQLDPGYWDPSLPRTAVQLIVLYRYNPDFRTGLVGEALTAAWDGLDWTRWRRLLEPPGR